LGSKIRIIGYAEASSCREIAQSILDACLDGRAWSQGELRRLLKCATAPDPALARQGSRALFQVLVEGLADRFEPRLSEAYAELFAQTIAFVSPDREPRELVARYHRVRRARAFRGDAAGVSSVYVLSRVTLGADVAVTSVVLDAAKRRFPKAAVILVGGTKNRQLFAADARIQALPASYGRQGTLGERLSVGRALAAELSRPGSIVIDPDSRLTQLGLLPVCPEENYYFFESRSYGGDGADSLTTLTQRWLGEVFAVPDAAPYIAPAEAAKVGPDPYIVVNLGVGDNLAKRVPDPFEEDLLRALLRKGARLLVDLGAGGEEEERVRRAIARCGAPESRVRPWRGSFSALAALIAGSRLYVGYDSAGQHAAAACGTPLVTVFAGFASPRMFARWHPTGPGPKQVIRVDHADPRAVLEQTLAAVDRLIPNPGA
jgi:ADP-heptose:LPS heptosyltransferase